MYYAKYNLKYPTYLVCDTFLIQKKKILISRNLEIAITRLSAKRNKSWASFIPSITMVRSQKVENFRFIIIEKYVIESHDRRRRNIC